MASRTAAGHLAAAILAALALISPLSAQGPAQGPVKVMAIGDSITHGFTGHAGWRYWLWNELQENGYTNVDFIGTQHQHFLGPALYSGYDEDHEAFWGARADQVLDHIPFALDRLGTAPDVALIHLGHNDVIQGQSILSTAGEILALIDRIRAVNPTCAFVVAKVIPTANLATNANLQVLNQLLESWQPILSRPTSPIILADQWTGFDPANDLYDGVHPNETGEKKMSNVWLRAMGQVFGDFKIQLSHDPATGMVTATNLGGPKNASYLSVVTANPLNANGGLGNGWFGGLFIDDPELFDQAAILGPPFVGTLDGYGSSIGSWHADPVQFPVGTILYSNTLAWDSTTNTIIRYATPTSITL